MLWLVNVHDFYKSNDVNLPPSVVDKHTPKQSCSYESIHNTRNLEQIYARLNNIIPIDPLGSYVCRNYFFPRLTVIVRDDQDILWYGWVVC